MTVQETGTVNLDCEEDSEIKEKAHLTTEAHPPEVWPCPFSSTKASNCFLNYSSVLELSASLDSI